MLKPRKRGRRLSGLHDGTIGAAIRDAVVDRVNVHSCKGLDDTLPDSECGFELWFAATGDLVLGARCNLRETGACEQTRQVVSKHVVPAVRRPPPEEGVVE